MSVWESDQNPNRNLNKSLKWFLALLLGTLATGLSLRWQLAGVSADWIARLDLRRAHSHLGFYGVLFPAAWIYLSRESVWIPKGRLLVAYFMLAFASGLAFLLQGYGFPAIVSSTAILAVWLIFAWKNWRRSGLLRRDWLAPASLAIVFSAAMIPIVAVMTHRNPQLAHQLARTFLTLLLFGVFIPSALRSVGAAPPSAWAWLVGTCLGAAFLTELAPHPLMGFGLVWISYFIISGLTGKSRPAAFASGLGARIHFYWLSFAIGLGLSGLGLMPNSYYVAIAGIHFLVLGPLLMTFAFLRLGFKPAAAASRLYEASLLTMVSAIALQGFVTSQFMVLQKVAATAGSVLVVSIVVAVFTHWKNKEAH